MTLCWKKIYDVAKDVSKHTDVGNSTAQSIVLFLKIMAVDEQNHFTPLQLLADIVLHESIAEYITEIFIGQCNYYPNKDIPLAGLECEFYLEKLCEQSE